MARLGPYEVHPFADDFPQIDGDEFDELVLSIKTNGLREPIVLNHDKTILIDGRNRYRACEAAGADAVFETLGSYYTEPMILDYIADKNIHHRHLTTGQRAFAGLSYERRHADAAKVEEKTRKIREPANQHMTSGNSDGHATPADLRESRRTRESSERAARAVGTSGRAVQQAKYVDQHAPDLASGVQSGQSALDTAYKQARDRERSKPKPEPAPKPSSTMLTLRTHTGTEIEYPQPSGKATFNETKGDGISWAAWSWNPVTGCLHGCDYCYAREIATNERYASSYPVGFTPLYHHERLDAPSNTRVPERHRHDPAYRRVFVCSMADLYGRWVPREWIDAVHASMLAAPQWEYLLLTKFPDRYVGLDLPPNAWVGTSVDEQKRVRIAERAFRQIDGVKVKWLSLEPLLAPLEFTDLSMFDWVVIGAQTGTRQPDGHVDSFSPPWEWVVNITKQAHDAGCKVHWKPNLHHSPGMVWPDEYPES